MTYDEVVEVLRSWVGSEVTRDPIRADDEAVTGTLHEGHYIPPEAGIMVEKLGEGEVEFPESGVIVETSRYQPTDDYALFTISRVADSAETIWPFGLSFFVSRPAVTRAEWVPGAEAHAFDLAIGDYTVRLTRERD